MRRWAQVRAWTLYASFATAVSACATVPSIASSGHHEKQGVVEVSCLVASNGTLDDCRVISERPTGQGFGQAALESTRKARLSNSNSAGARVNFTVRFELERSAP